MINRKISIKVVYLLVILVAALITLGTLLYLRFTTTEGVVLKDDLAFDFREEVYVSDIVSYIDGSLVDDYKLDTSEVGFKDVVVTFKNKYGFIVGKSVSIEIRDVTSPVIMVNNPYVVYVGSDIKLEDSIFCADDYDDNVKCDIIGEYDLNKRGSYELEMVARDYSGNVTSKKFTLKVLEKKNSVREKDSVEKYTSFKSVYNKYKNNNTLVGLDISKWQGDVDYSKLKSQGVSFVMLKIGGQTEIGGEFVVDPKFYNNIEAALDNDIKVGVYFIRMLEVVRRQSNRQILL